MRKKELFDKIYESATGSINGLPAIPERRFKDLVKSLHGGSRPNSGRKKGLETKTISFRLKLDQIDPVKELVKQFISK